MLFHRWARAACACVCLRRVRVRMATRFYGFRPFAPPDARIHCLGCWPLCGWLLSIVPILASWPFIAFIALYTRDVLQNFLHRRWGKKGEANVTDSKKNTKFTF